ncbi:MAG: hypothetical protein IKY83_09020 [Proteobacteria bacterium]|nr:hypothetical protein [Pseudomonadota bacterium]
MKTLEKHGLSIALVAIALSAIACTEEGPNKSVKYCGDTICTENQVCDEATQKCKDIVAPPTDCKGLDLCGTSCVDLTSDVNNCGICGNKCGSEQSCISRICTDNNPSEPKCTGDLTECGDQCVDLTSDADNCGTCGNKCPSDHTCTNSTCVKKTDDPTPDTPECQDEEAPTCDGNSVRKCVNGKYTQEPCGDLICNAGVCEAPSDPTECDPAVDLPSCEGDAVKKCVDGKYVLDDCGEKICEEGACHDKIVEPECEDSEAAVCDADNNVVSCKNGQYVSTPCGDQVCAEGACIDPAPDCSDDEAPTCEENAVKKCAEGKYVIEACEGNSLCSEGACHAPLIADICPDDASKEGPGICGCGIPDDDLDNNGITDCLEGGDLCPDDPDKTLPGICGCNIPDTLDGDGNPKCVAAEKDLCPNDPNKQFPGVCGCGFPDTIDPLTRVPKCVGKTAYGTPADYCQIDEDDEHAVKKYLPGACGCGIPDTIDPASGLPTCLTEPEICPEDDKHKPGQPAGICGCGQDDSLDSDGDGVPDCIDKCSDNPYKYFVDRCSCNEVRVSVDGRDFCAEPITTVQQFNAIRLKFTNTTNKAYALMNDINLGDLFVTGEVNDWKAFTDYKGKFVSYGKKISFVVDDEVGTLTCSTAKCGLFTSLNGARIDNLKIELNIEGESTNNGILAGTATSVKATNLEVKGNVSGKSTYAGGLFGQATKTDILHVVHEGDVIGQKDQVGGIVGRGDTVTFESIDTKGNVSGTTHVGGVVGYSTGITPLSEVKNLGGEITGTGNNVGGIAGITNGLTFEIVDNKANVTGASYTGGIVGQLNGGSVTKVTNDSTVKGTGTWATGGIAGSSSAEITDASNAGQIEGTRGVGGIAGYQNGTLSKVKNAADIRATNNSGNSSAYVGGIAGQLIGGFTHDDLTNDGNITAEGSTTTNYIGGIFGVSDTPTSGKTVVTHAKNTGDISTKGGWSGGIFGRFAYGEAQDCENTGSVYGSFEIGGIAGLGSGSSFERVKNTGKITNLSGYTGGIVGLYSHHAGMSERGIENKLENAENTGDVTGTYYTGGIVGYYQQLPENGIASFKDLKNTGNITGTESVGGMLGFMRNNGVCNFSTIESSAKIKGSASYIGGIFGRIYPNDNDCDGNPFEGSGERATAIHLDRAFSTGAIEGTSYVGGIAGYVHTTANNREIVEKTQIKCEKVPTTSRYNYTFKYHNIQNTVSFSNVYSTGEVKGESNVGGLVGDVVGNSSTPAYTNTTYQYVAYTQSDPCHLESSSTPYNETVTRAGKFILSNAFASGPVTLTESNTSAGGAFGFIEHTNTLGSAYNYILNNIYATGTVSTSGGIFIGNNAANVDYRNLYYWTEAGPSTASAGADVEGIEAFSYDNAIPMVDDAKLLDTLNHNIETSETEELGSAVSAKWIEKQQTLQNGVKVQLPMLDLTVQQIQDGD